MAREIAEIRLSKVAKGFQGRLLFSDFSYTFAPGRLYLFIGPSGCGKTTMLNLVAQYLSPSAGSVSFGRAARPSEDIAFFSQDSQIFMELTAKENLRLVTSDNRVIENALREAGLEKRANIRGAKLSKGEAARLAIARMAIQDKDVMLFDEPTGNLDEKNGLLAFRLLKKLSRDHIVIASSHDLDNAEAESDVVFSYGGHRFETTKETAAPAPNRPARKPVAALKNAKRERGGSPFAKLLGSLFSHAKKQTLILTPVFMALDFLFLVCFSFLGSDLEGAAYREMRRDNVDGLLCEKYLRSDSLTAMGDFISFGDDGPYPAIFNENEAFTTPSNGLRLDSPNGLAVPASLAETLSLSPGEAWDVSVEGSSLSVTVESVYPDEGSPLDRERLVSAYGEEAAGLIDEYRRPILMASSLARRDGQGDFVYQFAYCSTLYLARKESVESIPLYLALSGGETASFWAGKETQDRFYAYGLAIGAAFYAVASYLYLVGLRSSFRRKLRLYKYMDGNSWRGEGIVLAADAISHLTAFGGSLIAAAIAFPFLQNWLVGFYVIDNLSPLIELSFPTVAYSFLVSMSLFALLGLGLTGVANLRSRSQRGSIISETKKDPSDQRN
ncbi:MAG: ATP-binding cassette domain-containing protein [Bacilli bacterium]|jgi:ABC-type multidrug transport system ATPase subunit|nr:ATP-binding cassette domain-containing protein [Bacilli bacterium]